MLVKSQILDRDVTFHVGSDAVLGGATSCRHYLVRGLKQTVWSTLSAQMSRSMPLKIQNMLENQAIGKRVATE